MSAPKSSRLPWVIVTALGCLVLCLCLVIVSSAVVFMSGGNLGALIAGVQPTPFVTRTVATFAPLLSATPAKAATATPIALATLSSSSSSAAPKTPQCPPPASLAAGILFNDDFGSFAISSCNGWLLAPGQNVDHTWAQNKYTFSINQTDYLGFDWPDGEYDNLAVEAEAQPISDGVVDYGIAFRISGTQDARSYYMFAVTSDGKFYVQEKLAGDWVNDDPVKSTLSSAIKQGKTKNTIGAIARGNSIALYINHVLVKTFTDNTLLTKGAAGIFGGSNDTNAAVTYTRFTVLTPDKAQADWR